MSSGLAMLKDFGPPKGWSGAMAAGVGSENTKKMKDAWEKLSATEKKRVEMSFKKSFRKGESIQPLIDEARKVLNEDPTFAPEVFLTKVFKDAGMGRPKIRTKDDNMFGQSAHAEVRGVRGHTWGPYGGTRTGGNNVKVSLDRPIWDAVKDKLPPISSVELDKDGAFFFLKQRYRQ